MDMADKSVTDTTQLVKNAGNFASTALAVTWTDTPSDQDLFYL